MKKFCLIIGSLFLALTAHAINYDKRVQKVEDKTTYSLVIHVEMETDDPGLEAVLAREMFHGEGAIIQSAEAYLSRFEDAKKDVKKTQAVMINARVSYQNDETGLICVSYVSAGEEHLGDVSEMKHITYDRKTGQVVKMSDLVTPALVDYLKNQGFDAASMTNILATPTSYTGWDKTNNLKLNPYKLHEQMTDYGLELISLSREKIMKQLAENEDLITIKEIVDEMPSFPGGMTALMGYMSKNIKYPAIAQKLGIEGPVRMSFVIDYEGKIKDISIVNSVDPSLDTEAVRVIRNMPDWKPAMKDGHPVSVVYQFPVTFRLGR